MARKYNLFNFLERKLSNAELSAVAEKCLEQVAFKDLALYIAVSYIANALSKCEFKVYEKGEESHGLLYYRLNVSPNHNENSSQFINKVITKYFYEQEALVVMHNDMLYCADSFDVDDSQPLKEAVYFNVTFENQTLKKKYKASEVFHFKLDDKNVKELVDSLYAQYGEVLALALQTFKATNGRKYKLLLERYNAGDPKFVEDYNNVIKAQLEAFIHNDNAVYPQFKGQDLQEFKPESGRATTADIIAMRKEIFDTVAQAIKIPLPMMYGNMNNMAEIVKVFLTFAVDPHADMISEELTRKKYSFEEWKAGSYVEVDTSCINYTDILEVADKADKAISSGLTCIDELRPRLRLPKLGTDFSQAHFMTKNYELADNILESLEKEESEDD